MRADAFNSHVDPVRMKINGTQHIPISHVYDLYESESIGIITDKNLFQLCSTDESESESVLVDESST